MRMSSPALSAPLDVPLGPPPVLAGLAAPDGALPKRERTRRLILATAAREFAENGVAAVTIQEIAGQAGVANGTFYNHFKTKEELLEALALWMADTLCRQIEESYADIKDGARRMSIGNRRYILLGVKYPRWALMLMDVATAVPQLLDHINGYALADLRLGIRQKSFRVASEAAALNLINGTAIQAIRQAAVGLAPAQHDIAVSTTILRGLGMEFDAAAACARLPLPPLTQLQALPVGDDAAAAPTKPGRGARRALA